MQNISINWENFLSKFTICLFLIGCSSIEEGNKDEFLIHTNEKVEHLLEMEGNEEISVSVESDMYLFFIKEPSKKLFNDLELNHRIDEVFKTWRCYQIDQQVVIIGSVAKSDNEAFQFFSVYEDQGDGVITLLFCEVGNEVVFGTVPDSIANKNLF